MCLWILDHLGLSALPIQGFRVRRCLFTANSGQVIGMRQRVGQRQALVETGQGLIWVPQRPEGLHGIVSAGYTRV
jgi:hypothetical protein